MKLHQRALELVRQHQRVEAELISVLRAIDDMKLYREHGATSLFAYATKILGLSESVAWNFITVSRATKKSPILRHAIETGVLSVSKARRITSILTQENQAEWVEKARILSQRELEKAVATVNPSAATPDRISYVTGDFMRLEVGFSETELAEIKYVQDLVSQSTQAAASLRETILTAIRFYKQRKDPMEKAERAKPGKPDSSQVKTPKPSKSNGTQTTIRVHPRKALPASILHTLARRDQNQCTHIDSNGSRCLNRRWLERHHVVPKSEGGKDALDNLIMLCRAHHQQRHGPTAQVAGSNQEIDPSQFTSHAAS